tara:strand:+ start:9341 stop:9874 length:534 start_codon:yes stop_codon:yes gene_type:complete
LSELNDDQKKLFDKLTPLQKGVVLGVLEGKKPGEAHKAANGKCKNEKQRNDLGNQILNKPNVKVFMDSVKAIKEAEALENALGSFNNKRDVLIEVYQRCMQAVPVKTAKGKQVFVKGPTGNAVAAFCFDPKGVISAVGELNKMDGDHAAQRVDLGLTEDLAKLIQEGRNRMNPNDNE